MQSGSHILVEEQASGLKWVTIDRPAKHNALAREVLDELAGVVNDLSARDDTRCIVLAGAGDRYFAAGGDLVDLATIRSEADTIDMVERSRAALDAIRDAAIPVLAYLNGDAIGGGAELALSCDMRMQGAKARIGFIQAKLAITSAWGGGPDLCQLVGPSRALRMMSRCELVDAEQALAWGLADTIIDEASAEAEIMAFIAPLLAHPPQVLRGIKAQTRAFRQGRTYPERRAIERENLLATWLHDDHWAASEKILSKAKRCTDRKSA